MKWHTVLPLVILSSCAPKIYNRSEFVDQILKPRKGFEGFLTNSRCTKRKGDDCKNLEIEKYDLNDDSFRRTVNRLDFICMIGNKRYKVCLDKVGFCRRSFRRNWLGRRKFRYEKYIPAYDYDFLIKSKLRCFNKYKYYDQFSGRK